MKLPRAEDVEIDARKILDYLLSQTHPVGRFKARVFARAGFNINTAEGFIAEIRRIAAAGEIAAAEDFEFGRKYTVPGELVGPLGSTQVLTVWLQEPGRAGVRLVTVRPR